VSATQLRLVWQWAFVFTDGAPVTAAPRLTWHHTEFGRRSDCERYRIVHNPAGGWWLLDARWDPIAAARDIAHAQQLAQQRAAREHFAEPNKETT
jgi:hypothetical protein